MATPKTVWGIDIGQVALKALKLRNVAGEFQVEAFDIIEHPKILSQPDADRRQLIRNALEQFLATNNTADSQLAISVPGQTSFTRFVKLPPVSANKIPDIVRYEAEQQIPFPIDDVIWRWQTFPDPDSPDLEVGIFAMKRLDIFDMLDRFTEVGLGVDVVQMAPLALYNFMMFDGQAAPEGATLLADVGADKTDLVVSDGPRMWTRTIQIGGNNFTEALVRAFKLSFARAETLKRTAVTSKYARQVFQAMRPVFADLVQEIQRSIGFYTALHRETRFKRLVGLGNGFRLPGLQKYLEQNLNMPVVRIDSYNKLTPSAAVNVPAFTENNLSFAVAYGLALQAMGETTLTTNLLPTEIASKRHWVKKQPWFAVSAAALLAALAMPVYSNHKASAALTATESTFVTVKSDLEAVNNVNTRYQSLKDQIQTKEQEAQKYLDLFKYRDFWPWVETMLSQSLTDPSVAFHQGLLTQYSEAADEKARQAALAELKKIPRAQRQIMMIDKMTSEFGPDVAALRLTETAAAPTAGGAMPPAATPAAAAAAATGNLRRGFKIIITGRTTLPEAQANEKLSQAVRRISEKCAAQSKVFSPVRYEYKTEKITPPATTATPAPLAPGAVAGPLMPDPFLPDEDMSGDTKFTIGWIVAVDEGDSTATAKPAL